ncbi:hypothetical protein ACLQ9F_00095 [Bordetella avium]|uniref:hypothetical protein n=1 Tax=Bordetella avium TaxID=521 RepID=UPI0039FC4C38
MKVRKLFGLPPHVRAVALLGAALAMSAPLLTAPAQARVIDAAVLNIIGDITALDAANRIVTIKERNGETLSLKAGPEIRNFDRIKIGDTLRLRYYESLAITTRPKGSGVPEVRTETAQAQSEPGQMPGGGAAGQTVITAEIWHINRATNTVILQGPSGKRETIVVRDPLAIKKLGELKEGDLVDFTFTRTMAGAVIAPASSKP